MSQPQVPQRRTPVIDVVIPVWNGETSIEDVVRAVLAQKAEPIHLVVVDDGSTDDTAQVLRHVDDPRLTVVERTHRGASAARNAGMRAGTGDYVVFLDSDDEVDARWLPELRRLARHADLVGCAGTVLERGSLPRMKSPRTKPAEPRFLAGLFMVRREFLEAIGGYDETLLHSENTDLGYRLMEYIGSTNGRVRVTQDSLVTIRRDEPRRDKYPARLKWSTAEALLAKNPHWYSRYPSRAGTYHAIAGYSALQLGDTQAARHHLNRAVRLSPYMARYWLLWLRTWSPVPQRRGRIGRGTGR